MANHEPSFRRTSEPGRRSLAVAERAKAAKNGRAAEKDFFLWPKSGGPRSSAATVIPRQRLLIDADFFVASSSSSALLVTSPSQFPPRPGTCSLPAKDVVHQTINVEECPARHPVPAAKMFLDNTDGCCPLPAQPVRYEIHESEENPEHSRSFFIVRPRLRESAH